MEIKVNGVPTSRLTRVEIAPTRRAGSKIVYSEGQLFGEQPYFEELAKKEFTLDIDGKVYNNCRIKSATTGKFAYFNR